MSEVKPFVIGFTGLARSGKDTSANYLLKYGFQRRAFADKLKEAANDIFGFRDLSDTAKETPVAVSVAFSKVGAWVARLGYENISQDVLRTFCEMFQPYERFSEGEFVLYVISPRKAYQLLGTEVFRQYDPDVWVNNIDLDVPRVVISDVRFPNEATICDFVVEVVNPRAPAQMNHKSEAGLPKELIDFTIVNYGTLEELYQELDDLMSLLTKDEVNVENSEEVDW